MPRLDELLALDERAFRERFAGTPLLRAKRRGLLRNAAVALGNSGLFAARPALERAATDSDEQLRAHAAWALRRLVGGATQCSPSPSPPGGVNIFPPLLSNNHER